MGKKLKILVLTATLTCFASSFVSAETIATDTLIQSDTNDKVEQASYSDELTTEDGFRYKVNSDETITITGYQGSETEISIPNKIDGKSITSIGLHAFSNCNNLKEINIPKGVTSIGGFAFNGCSSLSKINIPEGVISIGGWAFNGCSSLSKINIPEGVISIGGWAFNGCSSLSEINIPESVTLIEYAVFSECSNLSEITVDKRNSNYSSEDGVLYNREKSKLISCPGRKKEMAIPKEVTEIEGYAFSGCNNLKEINIPEGITSIGFGAFSKCTNLIVINTNEKNKNYLSENGVLYNKEKKELISCPGGKKEVIIPKGVTSINSVAFLGCSNLKEINIPEGVTSIGLHAFSNCNNLKEINIPEGVTFIGDYAFSNCSSLNKINIPKGIEEIGSFAFSDCSSLSTVTIPEGIKVINNGIFFNCSALREIGIPEGVTSIKCLAFCQCSNLKEINIPESLTKIESDAFNGCISLKEVKIPEGATTIEDAAFNGCSSLSKVKIPEGVRSIGEYVFVGSDNLTIYGEENSYAQEYANKNNIPFKLSSEYDKDDTNTKPDGTVTPPKDDQGDSKPETPITKKYTVKFLNEDGTQIGDVQEIEEGKSAVAPANPTKEGYTFKGWDKDFSNITSDMEVKAIFEKNAEPGKTDKPEEPGGIVTPPKDDQGDSKPETPITKKYTVKFLNEDGIQIGDVQEIEEGKSAVAPANPTKEGYTFKGWDKDFSNVTSNMEVKAIFEKNAEPGKTDKPEEPNGTATPPKDNQGSNEPTNPNPPKGDDGTNKDTSDVSSMAGIFTMFAGLIGTIGFKRKRK